MGGLHEAGDMWTYATWSPKCKSGKGFRGALLVGGKWVGKSRFQVLHSIISPPPPTPLLFTSSVWCFDSAIDCRRAGMIDSDE